MRQLAGSNGAVINEVVAGARLFDNFAGKGEGGGRGEDRAVAAEDNASAPGHIVEAASFGGHVVGPVAGLNMVVVRTAIKRDVAGGGGFSAVGVVGDFVGAEDVIAIVDFGVAVQFVDFAVFFLRGGADGGLVGFFVGSLAGAGSGGGLIFLLGYGS